MAGKKRYDDGLTAKQRYSLRHPEKASEYYQRTKAEKAEKRRLQRAGWTPEQWAIHNEGNRLRQRTYYAKHGSSYVREDVRRRFLKSKYGLTQVGWDALFEVQGKRCASCKDTSPTGGSEAKSPWRVDHDHVTGRVRGILCHHCNIALGHLKDDAVRVNALALYIKGWSE